jgi:membrane peptidoglycan carboxypeptidase
MTNAYAVFANGGKKVSTTTIIDIQDKRGTLVYEYKPQLEQVLDPRVAFLISSILSDNKARSEVFGNALSINRPAAVKTGTTNDYRDALTIGYTPSLVIGVWVGNNDNSPMNNIAGSLGAAPIWRTLMQQYLAQTPIEHFNPPSGVDVVKICKENGKKSRTATSSAYFEYFLSNTSPTTYCDQESSPTPTISPTTTPASSDTPTPQPTNAETTLTPTITQPSATPIEAISPTPILTITPTL